MNTVAENGNSQVENIKTVLEQAYVSTCYFPPLLTTNAFCPAYVWRQLLFQMTD